MQRFPVFLGLLLATLASPAWAGIDLAALRAYAFVAGRDTPEVAVLDMRDASIAARLHLPQPAYQMSVNEQRGELIVGSLADHRVAVIDLATLREKRSVVLDHEPEHMQLGPGGDVLAVGNFYADGLTLIDLDDMSTRRVAGLSQPHNVLFSPDGTRLYVANLGDDRISVVDVASGRLLPALDVPRSQHDAPGITSLMLSRDGRRAWAIPSAGTDLAVLDVATGRTLRSDHAGPQPWRVAMTSDERLMLTANTGDQTLSLLSTADGREIARLDGTDGMEAILPVWFDTTGFVVSKTTKELLAVDLEAPAMLPPLPLPGTPEDAMALPGGEGLVVALSEPGGIAIVDARERRVVKLLADVLPDPFRIAAVGSRNVCN